MPTIKEIAKEVGVSRQTLYAYRRDHGVDIKNIDAVKAHIAAKGGAEETASPVSPAANLRAAKTQAEIERIKADTRARELANAASEGAVVDRKAVESFLLNFVNETRSQIESWPDYVITELPGEVRVTVHTIISEQVRLLLLRLSEMPADLWADESVQEV